MLTPEFELFTELFNEARLQDFQVLKAKRDLIDAQLQGGFCCQHPAIDSGIATLDVAGLHAGSRILADATDAFEQGIATVVRRHDLKEKVLPTEPDKTALIAAVQSFFNLLGLDTNQLGKHISPPIPPEVQDDLL